jgi:hypothetical protein
MPVYKYKSLEAAEEHLKQLMPKDALTRVSDLQDLVYTLKPPGRARRGLFRFNDMQEANVHRENTTG